MKARPFKKVVGGMKDCDACDADYVIINIPGPSSFRRIPVCLSGSRDEASRSRKEPVWSWNGDVDRPTLNPSIRIQGVYLKGDRKPTQTCHTWITDGKAQFLSDCTHELAGKTLDLLDTELWGK